MFVRLEKYEIDSSVLGRPHNQRRYTPCPPRTPTTSYSGGVPPRRVSVTKYQGNRQLGHRSPLWKETWGHPSSMTKRKRQRLTRTHPRPLLPPPNEFVYCIVERVRCILDSRGPRKKRPRQSRPLRAVNILKYVPKCIYMYQSLLTSSE